MPTQFEDQHHFTQWNEDMARKYDPESYHLRSNFLIRWIERRRVEVIRHFLNVGQQDCVLEVGCGAGNVLEKIPSKALCGIDLSSFLIRKSQKRLAHRRAILVQANAERLPFSDGQFCSLVCTEVLEHVPDPRQIVREMARVATANAVLVISVPNEIWINRVKRAIQTLGLNRWLLQGGKDQYSSPDRMTDEWHLHSFDLALFQEVTKDILYVHQIKPIPFALIPLRYVALCRDVPRDARIP